MAEGAGEGSSEIPDPNEILNALLVRVEEAIQAIQATTAAASGLPLFAVEADLHAALPDVRFTAQDIRAWSAHISS